MEEQQQPQDEPLSVDQRKDCAVKIAVRERPFVAVDQQQQSESIIKRHNDNVITVVTDEKVFAFDYILEPDVTQQQLFDKLIKPMLLKFFKGFCCTALAYGQTGTGKSYTMGLQLDDQEFDKNNVGIIPRTLEEVFNTVEHQRDCNETNISVSFLEIYNEKGYDLLSENFAEQINAKGRKCIDVTKLPVNNMWDSIKLLRQGNKNRHVRPTKMNVNSSRSHAVFTIHALSKSIERQTISAFHLVDLAGSESVRRTGHQGVALTEGVNINQGLLSIGKVLQALTDGCKVIPYRDSVLSTVLKDSLNLNSYLTLVACISPLKDDYNETLSTLRFADNAKSLRNNPQVNAYIAELKKKTPKKLMSYMRPKTIFTPTPQKLNFGGIRPFVTSTAFSTAKRKTFQNNTFCTPNKTKRLNTYKRGHTELILTPMHKEKLQSNENNIDKNEEIMNYNLQPPLLTQNTNIHEDLSQSFLNISNISSSTVVVVDTANHKDLDYQPITKEIDAFSRLPNDNCPILREMDEFETKLMQQIDSTLNTKFNYTNDCYSDNNNMKQPKTTLPPFNITTNNNNTNIENIPSIDFETRASTTTPEKLNTNDNYPLTTSTAITMDKRKPFSKLQSIENNVEMSNHDNFVQSSQTFSNHQISPIIRRMEEMRNKVLEKYQSTRNEKYNNTNNASNYTITENVISSKENLPNSTTGAIIEKQNDTHIFKIPQPPIVSSSNIMIQRNNKKNNGNDVTDVLQNITNTPTIQSIKHSKKSTTSKKMQRHTISTLMYYNENSDNIDLTLADSTNNLTSNTLSNQRRSQRISKKKIINEREKAADQLINNKVVAKNIEKKPATNAKLKPIGKPKVKPNSVAEFMNNIINVTPGKQTKSQHKSNILKLINSGTIKELQFLPQVGMKTAYQIIAHRSCNGKITSFEALSKLPIWRGKSWNRFLEANMLS